MLPPLSKELSPTLEFRTFPARRISDQSISFIDSPGLGDSSNTQEILLTLVEYLSLSL